MAAGSRSSVRTPRNCADRTLMLEFSTRLAYSTSITQDVVTVGNFLRLYLNTMHHMRFDITSSSRYYTSVASDRRVIDVENVFENTFEHVFSKTFSKTFPRKRFPPSPKCRSYRYQKKVSWKIFTKNVSENISTKNVFENVSSKTFPPPENRWHHFYYQMTRF